MALKSIFDGENGISQYPLDNAILSEQFDVIPFKDFTVIEKNLNYTEEWVQNQRHELAVYASSYFIESGKVETETKQLKIQRKACKTLGFTVVNSDLPLRACVNMDGLRACLFEAQKQHEMVLVAKGNIQFAWSCNQDQRLIGLNKDLLELDKHWQDLIKEMQEFIGPEFEAQKKVEENLTIKSEKCNEVTAQIPQMLAGIQREHSEYTKLPLN